MEQFGSEYHIDTLDMHGDSWKKADFSVYDSVFHVAGIAHADVSKVNEETKQLYYKVNCDLAVEVAKKFSDDLSGNKGHFIYMSSIIVYGDEINIRKKRVITKQTIPKPSNFYGDSKLKAERLLNEIENKDLIITIVRPPMIYGKNSKGNYKQLVKLVEFTSFFPNVKNERSVLSINRLSAFIKNSIDNPNGGIFFPHDPNTVSTADLVESIAKSKNKKIYFFSFLNWLIYLLGFFPGKVGKLINKAFGNLVYKI